MAAGFLAFTAFLGDAAASDMMNSVRRIRRIANFVENSCEKYRADAVESTLPYLNTIIHKLEGLLSGLIHRRLLGDNFVNIDRISTKLTNSMENNMLFRLRVTRKSYL